MRERMRLDREYADLQGKLKVCYLISFSKFTHQNHMILNLEFQTIILDEAVFTFMNATNSDAK